MIAPTAWGIFAGVISLQALQVLANCECGYTVNTNGTESALYTEVLETDFSLTKDVSLDTDWVVQEWKVESGPSHGPYGRETKRANVIANPSGNDQTKPQIGQNGSPAGIELFVRKLQGNSQYVGVAEIDSARTDMFYGSFRAGINVPKTKGTCAAFFWYFNDTQEIDMEILTAQINDTSRPIHLVLHSPLSQQYGGDASQTPYYQIKNLDFEPSNDMHEYRFDWSPGRVDFYADGKFIQSMQDDIYVPSAPGKIIMSHWSNGNSKWSGGPPDQDAAMTVSYVKAYFNSSNPTRKLDYKRRCKDRTAPNMVCKIPDQQGPPNIGSVPFFYKDTTGDMTPNQTIYARTAAKKKNGAALVTAGWTAIVVPVAAALFFMGGF
ncbi:concanavalin A-like lectin/glucanase domain-containing protein [Pyronema omphalodes]|nr:concanavalin A-like lectin/glucanase domain-containing protein [Pyronema omphalodes]